MTTQNAKFILVKWFKLATWNNKPNSQIFILHYFWRDSIQYMYIVKVVYNILFDNDFSTWNYRLIKKLVFIYRDGFHWHNINTLNIRNKL